MEENNYQYQNITDAKISSSFNYKANNSIQYKRKKEKKIIGNKLLFYLLCLFSLIIPAFSQTKNNSEISIKINGTGNQRLISNDDLCPDEIYINETKIGENKCVVELTNPLIVIRMLWFKNLTTFQGMFEYIGNIIWIDLSKFDSSLITSTHRMFFGCNSLLSINFNNFNTSLVTDMSWMFSYCNSLISINLVNFDTSLVTDMSWMFSYCHSLKYLNISNFDTSLVTDMAAMFLDCSSLVALNLTNFNTSLLTYMGSMFAHCTSLVRLNLSNFNTSLVYDMAWIIHLLFFIGHT